MQRPIVRYNMAQQKLYTLLNRILDNISCQPCSFIFSLAMVTSSGTAAMSMVIHSTLKAGDHIVTAHDVYGGLDTNINVLVRTCI